MRQCLRGNLDQTNLRVKFSRLVWLWFPLAIALIPPLSFVADRDFYAVYIADEPGLIENLTALLLLFALVAGLRAFKLSSGRAFPVFRYWILLLTIGCVYFLGEEISWGQHIFGWETPAGWAEINAQAETNLHNLSGIGSSLLNVFPRMLVNVCVGGGGILLPLYLYFRRKELALSQTRALWFFPPTACILTAMLAVLPRLPRKIVDELFGDAPKWLDVVGSGETKECLVAYFLLLYLAALCLRLRQTR